MNKTYFCAAGAAMAALCLLWPAGVRAQAAASVARTRPLLYNTLHRPLDEEVKTLMAQLTQSEKLSLLAMQSGGANYLRLNTPPVTRLGIPGLRTADSPSGVRDGLVTAFPMQSIMASTWDPSLVTQVAQAVGQEARAKDRQIIYGPDLNLQRSPQSGRTFECFSEDPFLVAALGRAYVRGIQGEGVAACVKHYVCNDQDDQRKTVDVEVDERTLHEMYLYPFQDALQNAQAWAMMPAVCRVNGLFMSQNAPLVRGQALTDWGWDGLVIPDWAGIHDTAGAVNAGMDVEMPDPGYLSAANLTAALTAGKITQAQIDDMARRVLRLTLRTEPPDHSLVPVPADAVNSPAHQALAEKAAEDGVILLKNQNGLLPLDRRQIHSLAVIGPNAADTQLGGRWSADVTPAARISVLQGIQSRASAGITVQFAPGCPRTGPGDPAQIQAAAALAAKSDAAVVVVGTDSSYEGEELDPPSIELPGDQAKLIQAVAAANKNTLVILNDGTPMDMTPWLGNVRGLIEGWYAGENQGNALAAILFGDVDPSGKLTETIAARRQDYSDFGSYPTVNGVIKYTDGVFVGYRHFDKDGITPLFPFGFGLSYTAFAYSGLTMGRTLQAGKPFPVRVTIRNTGPRAGDEIAELYVHPMTPSPDRPVQELKGFARVALLPGRAAAVTIPLDPSAFEVWDTVRHAWKVIPGNYEVRIGASSRDIRLRGTLQVR